MGKNNILSVAAVKGKSSRRHNFTSLAVVVEETEGLWCVQSLLPHCVLESDLI